MYVTGDGQDSVPRFDVSLTNGVPFSLMFIFVHISRFSFSGATNARAHLAWVVTRPVRQTARNRLKIGVRREGTVSDDILVSQRLNRTDG